MNSYSRRADLNFAERAVSLCIGLRFPPFYSGYLLSKSECLSDDMIKVINRSSEICMEIYINEFNERIRWMEHELKSSNLGPNSVNPLLQSAFLKFTSTEFSFVALIEFCARCFVYTRCAIEKYHSSDKYYLTKCIFKGLEKKRRVNQFNDGHYPMMKLWAIDVVEILEKKNIPASLYPPDLSKEFLAEISSESSSSTDISDPKLEREEKNNGGNCNQEVRDIDKTHAKADTKKVSKPNNDYSIKTNTGEKTFKMVLTRKQDDAAKCIPESQDIRETENHDVAAETKKYAAAAETKKHDDAAETKKHDDAAETKKQVDKTNTENFSKLYNALTFNISDILL